MYYFIFGALTGLSLSFVVSSIYIFYKTKKYKNEIYLLNMKSSSEIEYQKRLISNLKLLKSELYLEKAKNKVFKEAIDKYGDEILEESFKQYTEYLKNNN